MNAVLQKLVGRAILLRITDELPPLTLEGGFLCPHYSHLLLPVEGPATPVLLHLAGTANQEGDWQQLNSSKEKVLSMGHSVRGILLAKPDCRKWIGDETRWFLHWLKLFLQHPPVAVAQSTYDLLAQEIFAILSTRRDVIVDNVHVQMLTELVKFPHAVFVPWVARAVGEELVRAVPQCTAGTEFADHVVQLMVYLKRNFGQFSVAPVALEAQRLLLLEEEGKWSMEERGFLQALIFVSGSDLTLETQDSL